MTDDLVSFFGLSLGLGQGIWLTQSITFEASDRSWAIPHWRAYMAKKSILFQQDETFTGDVKNM